MIAQPVSTALETPSIATISFEEDTERKITGPGTK
jgi:hypothetical protein